MYEEVNEKLHVHREEAESIYVREKRDEPRRQRSIIGRGLEDMDTTEGICEGWGGQNDIMGVLLT